MSGLDAVSALALAVSGVIAVRLFVVDVRSHRLPNGPVAAFAAAALVFAASRAALNGTIAPLVGGLAAGGILFAGYFLLHKAGGMGGGDVKLAGGLGILTGAMGMPTPVVATVVAFLAGGLFSLALLATRRASRRTRIPFGPFMLIGACVAVIVAVAADGGAVNPAGTV